MFAAPINLPRWLKENGHLLKPPINNYCVYNSDFTVMIVGGPNARTDFHINPTPEYFYQHRGAMTLRIVEGSSTSAPRFRDVIIHEGDMFLLPPLTPHSPIRFADTVGVVVEQRRPDDAPPDRLRWYCGAGVPGAVENGDGCGAVVHDDIFVCTDLGTQVKAAVERFRGDDSARECSACGRVAAVAHHEGVNRNPNVEMGA